MARLTERLATFAVVLCGILDSMNGRMVVVALTNAFGIPHNIT